MKALVAALLLAFPSAVFAQASVLLRTEVSPKEITIGDRVDVAITVIYSTAITPAPVKFPERDGDFEILSTQSSAPQEHKDGRMRVVHRAVLTTFSTGTVALPALPLYFKNADGSFSEARTDRLQITVNSVLAERGDEGGLRPLKGLFNARPLWPLWTALGAAAFGLLIWFIRKRRRSRPGETDAEKEPALSPEEEAQKALAELEGGPLMAEDQSKELYSALSAVLRRYAERRYGMPAPEMTSSELLKSFRERRVPTEPAYTARAFLDNADLVKFAKFMPPPEDVAADFARLRAFVAATTPQPPAPAEPSPEEAVPL